VIGSSSVNLFEGWYKGAEKIVCLNLQNAVNDARKMADLLSKQGFVVRCLLNPTQMTFSDEKTRLALFLQQQELNDPQLADGGRAVI
jgi:hypothetical protein